MSNPEPNKTHDVFVSYSRNDSEFATELRNALERYKPSPELGLPQRHLRVFLDASDFTGPDYDSAIETHLRNSDKLVVICSPNSKKQYVQ
jgi:hypothetical protein